MENTGVSHRDIVYLSQGRGQQDDEQQYPPATKRATVARRTSGRQPQARIAARKNR